MYISYTASKLYLWYCARERVQITLETALAMSVTRVSVWPFVRVCGQVAGSGDMVSVGSSLWPCSSYLASIPPLKSRVHGNHLIEQL